ncbi:YqcC family protein [Vibrio methylphosphonaticus]|uniref:YqcC family protein n=1 Tax=Vibrio methylphosphonaticus TaxID=2946866 RepID=UPI002029C05E|nr:YqcC family protein [Vibrio methylphosphonaticus]MCL9773141.1 YqcC family protein [Vibrio methylphosphonaticus]
MKQHIDELKQAMKQHGLWQKQPPAEEKFLSTQPFSIDTLAPEEWLQWVFVSRIEAMLAAGQALPANFEIAPYFEQSWQAMPTYSDVICILKKIDGASKS